MNIMAGYVATRDESFSSSNNFTRTQISPLDLVNEIAQTLFGRHPVPYLAPSTLRALKVDTIMRPITATLDSIFMKNFNTTQLNLESPSTQPNCNPLTDLARSEQPERPLTTSDHHLDPDWRQTGVAGYVQRESRASNERQIQYGCSNRNFCTKASASRKVSASPKADETFSNCNCPIFDGLPRKNFSPNLGINPNLSECTIHDALKSHKKNLIRCYPELSFLRRVPLILEPLQPVNSASYLSYLSDLLTIRTSPAGNRRCTAKSYFEDSKQGNDESSNDEDEDAFVPNSKSGRAKKRKQTALYSDHMSENAPVAKLSHLGGSEAPINSSEESASSQFPNESCSGFDPSFNVDSLEPSHWNRSSEISSDPELPPLKIMKLDLKISRSQ